ncbi:MAG: winged helix-turn-helix domain-containing protein [Eubacteriaceae bacterium]|nr:winged helix-turn-helix domain-containing protein [Eubacteriaceae bacterium]
MANLVIYMLGKFMVIADGQDIIQYLGSSKKKVELLAYLILNKEKNISAFDLYDMLWPNDENSNPESSLKTLISRLRTNLSAFDLRNAIVTKRGFYSWNDDLDADIDVFAFENLCAEVQMAESLTKETEERFQEVLALYQGDLLPNSSLDSWVVPKSMYYHNAYLEAVQKYVALLNAEGRYSDVVHVCRKGLDIDAFDSSLNLSLMTALLKMGKSREALAQYNCTTGLHYTYLGMNPSDEILDFYKKLIRIERASGSDIDIIRKELWEEDEAEGAFICEYAIFKDIYKLNMRNLKRLGTSMFLALISVDAIDNKTPDFLLLDKIMSILRDTLRDNLRRGDTVSRYSPYQFAILLPTVNHQTGQTVLERVKKEFYKKCSTSQFVINFKLKPISMEE